jgi:peptidoglycan hydrolase-like protein with peptidoglycan-binding domain
VAADSSLTADPVLGAAAKITRKPGQRWEYGPACFADERKAYVTELDTYLRWVNQVELELKDPAATAQRIRMMYYGRAAGSLSLFDALISSNSQWAGAPLTTNDVPQDTLDGLMGTGWVSVGVNQERRHLVDISHVWILLDAALNGLGWLGLAADLATSVLGVISWTGDLASWWTEYNDQKICYVTALPPGQTLTEDPANLEVPTGWLNAGQAARCAVDDLLGDMDGMILSTLGAPLVRNGSKTVTDLLAGYYLANQNTNPADKSFLHSDNRFHLFVRNCVPAIPYDDAGSGAAALNANSGPAVRALLAPAAHVLLLAARGTGPLKGIRKALPENYLKLYLAIPDFGALGIFTVYEIEQSVQRDISSPWGTAMINQVADEFTAFLTAGLAGTGWTSGSWPTAEFAIDSARHGGFVLQFGDGDASGTYSGTTQTPASYVANLQNDLITLGFDGLGTADGRFGEQTAMTLREFQIEASQPQIYAQNAGPATGTVALPVIRRYRGPVNGVATLETFEALAQWLQPSPPLRHCLVQPGPGVGLLQILNPVSISARSDVAAGNNGNIIASDMWWYGQAGASAAPYPLVYAADQLQRYPIPGTEVVGTDPGLACIGQWTTEGSGGPAIQQGTMWASSLVSLASLVPPPLDPASNVVRSQYRVVRAVAEVEDLGHFDAYNAWDTAILSFGLMHWDYGASGFSELGAFLSFYQSTDPAGYAADFGNYGIQPGSAWDPSTIDPVLRMYNGRFAMYGLHDANGTIQAGQLLPLQIGSASAPSADRYLSGWLRSWRGLHRVAMALRTSTSLQHVQWYFATQRVSNLLNTPWPGGSGQNAPVVTAAGAQNLATIGQVFTSEQAVAVLLRWHVNQPGTLLQVTSAFNPMAIQQAYVGAFGTGIVDVGAIKEPARSQNQQALVTTLWNLAASAVNAAELQRTMKLAQNYKDPDAGPLSPAADSYLGS